MDLRTQVSEWMAPNVPNGGRTASHAELVGATLYHGDKKVHLGLEHQAKEWSAPKASDGEKGGPNQRGSKGDVPLPGQAVALSQGLAWPAPAARDYKGANSAEHVTVNSKGSMHLDQLPNFVEHCFLLPSSPDHPILAGAMSSSDGPSSNQPSAKRKLNPIFVEALMRWPTGLSGFARQETALILWQQRMHGFLSMLCSPKTERQGELF